MKKINIFFSDFWGHENYIFNPRDNYFVDLLSQKYEVTVTDKDIDILFYSCFGNSHSNIEARNKIMFIGEQWASPNYSECTLSLSHYNESDNNIYFPLWALFVDWFDKDQPRPLPSNPTFHVKPDSLIYTSDTTYFPKSGFCCFINNNPVEDRVELFHKLNNYSKVDSYGGLFNNVGRPLRGSEQDKINLLNNYKFTIAYENSYHPGYNTEKIVQPLSVNCIPIYKGGERVKEFFNNESFIYANDFNSADELVEYISYVDSNPELYKKYIQSHPFVNNELPSCLTPSYIIDCLENKINL